MGRSTQAECGRARRSSQVCLCLETDEAILTCQDWMHPKMQELWTEAFKNFSGVVDFDGETFGCNTSGAHALI